MKTVLILTHVFPPVNVISVHRYVSFARHLPERGWRPIVLTPEWTLEKRTFYERRKRMSGPGDEKSPNWDPEFKIEEGLRVERVPFDNLDKDGPASRAGRRFAPRLRKTQAVGDLPERFSARAGDLCRGERIDLVLASNTPAYLFETAGLLRRLFGIPWVADYRDLVDQLEIGEATLYRNVRARISRRLALRRDQARVRSASARLTISEKLVEKLRARNAIPVHVVMNGFDPEEFAPALAAAAPAPGPFRIVYAGSIYPAEQDVGLFFHGLERLFRRRPELRGAVRAEFYGQSSDAVKGLPPAAAPAPAVVAGGTLGRAAILERMCASDALLFLSPKSKGLPTGKIYEYLGARRRILSVPGDGDITDAILSETGAGRPAGTPEAIADVLEAWIAETRAAGKAARIPDRPEIEKYTRRAQAGRLARVLDVLVP